MAFSQVRTGSKDSCRLCDLKVCLCYLGVNINTFSQTADLRIGCDAIVSQNQAGMKSASSSTSDGSEKVF
jgi:hypothetical protein